MDERSFIGVAKIQTVELLILEHRSCIQLEAFYPTLHSKLKDSYTIIAMEEIKLTPTQKTPSVHFRADGHLELKGRSIPENSLEFYKPLNDWIDTYSNNPASETTIHIQLEYFNTSSSKCLLDFFKRLESLGGKVSVLWYYEQDDEDMLEAGEDYEAIISVPFKMIEVQELN
jgi:hypothetical protein